MRSIRGVHGFLQVVQPQHHRRVLEASVTGCTTALFYILYQRRDIKEAAPQPEKAGQCHPHHFQFARESQRRGSERRYDPQRLLWPVVESHKKPTAQPVLRKTGLQKVTTCPVLPSFGAHRPHRALCHTRALGSCGLEAGPARWASPNRTNFVIPTATYFNSL